VKLEELIEGPEIAAKLDTAVSNSILSVKWVKHFGSEYRPGLVVCVEVANEMPLFCKIKTVFVRDGKVILIGSSVETICFDEYYHAFKILLKPIPEA